MRLPDSEDFRKECHNFLICLALSRRSCDPHPQHPTMQRMRFPALNGTLPGIRRHAKMDFFHS